MNIVYVSGLFETVDYYCDWAFNCAWQLPINIDNRFMSRKILEKKFPKNKNEKFKLNTSILT